MRTLILGYGNQDRQDDGVAWHLMVELRKLMGYRNPLLIDEDFGSKDTIVFVFQLQLMPEMAEEISSFDRICFLDAHTGSVPDEVHFETVRAVYQHSPLTHHLTAHSLLSVVQTIYNEIPEAILISVKGYEFEYSTQLSQKTARLVPQAAQMVLDWINRE